MIFIFSYSICKHGIVDVYINKFVRVCWFLPSAMYNAAEENGAVSCIHVCIFSSRRSVSMSVVIYKRVNKLQAFERKDATSQRNFFLNQALFCVISCCFSVKCF